MMKKYSIYICDDHLLFLESIEAFFNLQEKYICIGHASTLEKAYSEIIELKPDIILIDYHLKEKNGLDLLYMIRASSIESVCLMLTMRRDVNIRNKAKELGGNGYLLKSIGAEEMMLAFEKITQGSQRFFDSLEQERIKNGEDDRKTLSNRELEIAKDVIRAEGKPEEMVERSLQVS